MDGWFVRKDLLCEDRRQGSQGRVLSVMCGCHGEGEGAE